jgi:hypothetical protein
MAWGVGKLPLETTGMEETIAALRLGIGLCIKYHMKNYLHNWV